MTLKKLASLSAFALVLLPCCQKERRSDFRLYRFIDELRSGNILESPFLKAAETGPRGRSAADKSEPLLDLGSGENPFSLKRKLKWKGVETNILFAPPRSAYQYEPNFASGGAIEFGTGLIQDGSPAVPTVQSSSTEEGGLFRIRLEEKGDEKILFESSVRVPPPDEPHIAYHSLEVPALPKGSRLILETEGKDGLFAFWENPILYARGRKTCPVVLISIDTLRADHLGCYGYSRETSPSVDTLAEDSALFLNTYASSPWTLPSHVSLLTSLHGVNHQVYYEDEKMSPDLVTLADVLRAEGFMTTAFTDGGFVSRVYGFSKGFDSYHERENAVTGHDSAMRVFRMASEWLEGNAEKNFFLFLHTYQPHDPYVCPEPYRTMFLEEDAAWRSVNLMGRLGGYTGIYTELTEKERRNIIGLYDGEIRYTDEALVGPLIAKLKELGLYDSALIIFTSDHGEEFFDHQSWTHGHQVYDESLKVPLIIKFPKSRFAGLRLEPVVRLIDVMPTILDELGIPFPGRTVDGKSLLPVLRGKEREDRVFLADVGDNILNSHIGRKIAMSSGRDKIILNTPFSPEDLGFFTSPPRIVPPVELFNLAEDPRETRNVADAKPSLARRLNNRIVEIYRHYGREKPSKAQIDERLREELRALGYIR